MIAKFDTAKSSDERRVDSAITILSKTIPEQAADALEDYQQAASILRPVTDWRVTPIKKLLDELYLYPHRAGHNEMLVELHDFKEELHEARINRELGKQDMGETSLKIPTIFVIAVGIAIFILLRR